MTQCIDPKYYVDGHDLRTDRVLSLFRLLRSCRGRQVDKEDHILDIGCGPKNALPKFWDRTFSKILTDDLNYPKVDGIDVEPDDEMALPERFTYQQADINAWQITEDCRQKYSLITSVYAWHWIVGNCDLPTSQARATSLYQKAESLLQPDGRLAIQHLYTEDTMPEFTVIALEALRKSGIHQLATITLEEYRARRAKTWRLPAKLQDIEQPFNSFKELHPETMLNREFVGGSTSWHWKDARFIWAFWRSVNIPANFRDLNPQDYVAIENSFARVLAENPLKKLGLVTRKHRGVLYIRITVHSAHEIIRKGSLDDLHRSGVTVRPDMPNQVRKRLSVKISELESGTPWFGEGAVDYSSPNPKDSALLEVLAPILDGVDKQIAKTYCINLRQVSGSDIFDVGHMRNIDPVLSDHNDIAGDVKLLGALKKGGSITLSELAFASMGNPDDLVVFTGEPWRNHREWYSLAQKSRSDLKQCMAVCWVCSKTKIKDDEFNPENVIYCDYVSEIDGWWDKSNIVEFLRFLIVQLRGHIKSTLLITSSRAIQNDSANLDSASITFFQNDKHMEAAPHFPEIADCFLVIDALQELALIRERLRSRQQISNNFTHELKRVCANLANFAPNSAITVDGKPLVQITNDISSAKPEEAQYGTILLRPDLPSVVHDNIGLCFNPQGIRDIANLMALWCQADSGADLRTLLGINPKDGWGGNLNSLLVKVWASSLRLLPLAGDRRFDFSTQSPFGSNQNDLVSQLGRFSCAATLAKKANLVFEVQNNGVSVDLTKYAPADIGWLGRALLAILRDYARFTKPPAKITASLNIKENSALAIQIELSSKSLDDVSADTSEFMNMQYRAKNADIDSGSGVHTLGVVKSCVSRLGGTVERFNDGRNWTLVIILLEEG